MNIDSWNIKWNKANKKMTDYEIDKVVQDNKNKLLVAEQLVKDSDVFSFLEADSDWNAHKEVEGYKMIFCGRNYSNKLHNWNGILLYVKECYEPRVNKEVLKEFEANDSSCFLPVSITNDNEVFNCLFVWTVAKYITGKYGKPVEEEYYGYNRFNEIMCSHSKKDFKKTREFINGKKNNVIIIGDCNVLYPKSNTDFHRWALWNSLLEMMDTYSLRRLKNNKSTFKDIFINDYCFVSKSLYEQAKLDVKENKYGNVKSDHNLLSLMIHL